MKFEELTDAQLSFIHDHLVPDFAVLVRNGRQNAFNARKKVATDTIDKMPAAEPQVTALSQAVTAAGLLVASDFAQSMVAIEKVVTDADLLLQSLIAKQVDLTSGLAPLTAPDSASDPEKDEVNALRQKVSDLMPGGALPTLAGHADGMKIIAELERKLQVIKKVAIGGNDRKVLEGIIGSAPKTAAKLMDRIAWYDKRIGKSPVDFDSLKTQAELAKTLKAGVSSAEAEVERLENAPDSDFATEKEREDLLDAARLAVTEAEKLCDEAETKLGFMHEKKSLLDATLHGPLAPDRTPAISDDKAADLVDLAFQKTETGQAMIQALERTSDVDSTLDLIDSIQGYIDHKFEHAGDEFETSVDWYASKLLEASVAAPPDIDFEDLMKRYLDDGLHQEEEPFGPDPGDDKRVAHRTKMIAEALLDPTTGDFDLSEDALKLMFHLTFSPDAIDDATPMLAGHVLSCIEELKDTDVTDKLAAVGDPANDDAKALVRKTLGLAEDAPVTAKEARMAALTAFLTPIDQGAVGSCFTTAPARRFRKERPDEAMGQFCNMVSSGKYTAPNGREVPAVTKLNDNDGNPLLHSFEYCAAAVAASEDGSREKNALRTMMFQPEGLNKVKDIVGDTDWNAVRALLIADISGAFRITYDPTIETEKSSDGSSSQGRFVLVTKAPYAGDVDKPITTKDGYMACLHKIAEHSLTTAGYDKAADEDKPIFQKVKELIDSDAFKNCIGGGKTKPWEMASGGQEAGPMKAMFGGNPTRSDMLGKGTKPPSTATPEEKAQADGVRTKAVLDSLAKSMNGVTGDQVNIGTDGIHAFTALPQEDSFQSIMDPDPVQRGQKIDNVLVLPGRAIAAKDIPLERAIFMYNAEVEPILENADDTLAPALKSKIDTHRPTGAVKPKALQAAIDAALSEYLDAVAAMEADRWKSKQVGKGTPPNDTAFNAKRDEIKQDMKKAIDANAATRMMKALDVPKVRIADTNWGDAETHTYFVIAPDPRTGELRLWEEEEPDGSLKPCDDDWIYTPWDKTA